MHWPGHYPATAAVYQSGDWNTSKLSDGAHVLCCRYRSGITRKTWYKNQTSRFMKIKKHDKGTITEGHVLHYPTWLCKHWLPDFPLVSFPLFPTFSLLWLQLPSPGVDQDPLTWARGAAQHYLSQQGRVCRDCQRVEVVIQWLLAARAGLVVNLVHNTLQDRTSWVS